MAKQKQKRLRVSEDMTIYNAAAQKEQLLGALAGCSALSLDLSKVGDIDTAGFQLLLLAKREALKAGKSLHLTANSNAVGELLTLFNMADCFGDPAQDPASGQPVQAN